MAMDPRLAARLMEIPEMGEFCKYLAQEAESLDRSSDIEATDPVEVAVEVKARKIAYAKLADILTPLLNATNKPSPPMSAEYNVDPDHINHHVG